MNSDLSGPSSTGPFSVCDQAFLSSPLSHARTLYCFYILVGLSNFANFPSRPHFFCASRTTLLYSPLARRFLHRRRRPVRRRRCTYLWYVFLFFFFSYVVVAHKYIQIYKWRNIQKKSYTCELVTMKCKPAYNNAQSVGK